MKVDVEKGLTEPSYHTTKRFFRPDIVIQVSKGNQPFIKMTVVFDESEWEGIRHLVEVDEISYWFDHCAQVSNNRGFKTAADQLFDYEFHQAQRAGRLMDTSHIKDRIYLADIWGMKKGRHLSNPSDGIIVRHEQTDSEKISIEEFQASMVNDLQGLKDHIASVAEQAAENEKLAPGVSESFEI